MTQPCKICHGTGRVECPAQTCAHWCPCTVCNGTGKVEVWEDWSQGFAEEKVRKPKIPTVTLLGYEFPIICNNSLSEDEFWIIGKDKKSIVKAVSKKENSGMNMDEHPSLLEADEK